MEEARPKVEERPRARVAEPAAAPSRDRREKGHGDKGERRGPGRAAPAGRDELHVSPGKAGRRTGKKKPMKSYNFV